jgi:DNA-binding Lrp family transcriptional regulator
MNKTDLKLITALEENGRASYAQLARSLGISVATASQRVDQLLKQGTLTINAVPNPYKIIYPANAIICLKVPMDKIDIITGRMKSILNVNMVVTTFGRFNIVIAVYFKTLEKLHHFISTELSENIDIDEVEVYFVKDVIKRYDEVFNNRPLDQNYVKIDNIDEHIIEQLSENGRYSCAHIANKLGISISSVSKRLYRLLQEDVIHVKAHTDPIAIGAQANAFLFIQTDHRKTNNICSKLCSCPETVTLMSLINGRDIWVNVIAKNLELLYKFVKREMTPAAGIISMETLFRGEIIKRYYGTSRAENMLKSLH